MDLTQYEQYKFAIGDLLRRATGAAVNSAGWRTKTTPLFTRLAEDRFNLVLVGRFSRGKSSLVNAILGLDRLPTGIVPLTSVITSISYGTEERVILRFRSSLLNQEVPLSDLPLFVTQKGNPGNAKGISEAEVQLPSEFLRRGFFFVDTPGLGSAIQENTRTTQAFLPEADAFIFVTSFDSPLSSDEMQFLRQISGSSRRIFVVMNKKDIVDDLQREEALAFVRDQVKQICGPDTPKVFAISALQALQAKQAHDSVRLEESGVSSFERELVSFLLGAKRTDFLVRMCERAAEAVRGLPSSDRIDSILLALQDLSRRISNDAPSTERPAAWVEGAPGDVVAQLRPCEVCSATSSALWEFQCRYQHEITCDPAAQKELAKRGGLCSFHTRLYEESSSTQGVAESFPVVLEEWAVWLRQAASSAPRETLRGQLRARMPSERTCMFCNVRAGAEARALSSLASRIALGAQRSLDAMSALCMPHLVKLAERLPDDRQVRALLERQARLFERTAEDLRRSALKRDGVRRNLLSQEEESASHRALALVAQERTIADGTS